MTVYNKGEEKANQFEDFPDQSSAWAEVQRLHLQINPVDSRRGVAFAVGLLQSEIARSCSISQSSVDRYLERASARPEMAASRRL